MVAENKMLILHDDELLYKLLIHKTFSNTKLDKIEHFVLNNKDY